MQGNEDLISSLCVCCHCLRLPGSSLDLMFSSFLYLGALPITVPFLVASATVRMSILSSVASAVCHVGIHSPMDSPTGIKGQPQFEGLLLKSPALAHCTSLIAIFRCHLLRLDIVPDFANWYASVEERLVYVFRARKGFSQMPMKTEIKLNSV